jgi:AcrR family transcriptional regulator
MPHAGLDTEAVVDAAAALADAEGLDAVTLARLARILGVRAPSLYAHVDGLPDLLKRLGTRGADELAATLETAAVGREPSDALSAVAQAYRTYAHEHPGRYAAAQHLPAIDPRDAQNAARRVLEAMRPTLRGYGIDGDDAIHAGRLLRAALYGFVSLEVGKGFAPEPDLEESFRQLVALLDRGLAASG